MRAWESLRSFWSTKSAAAFGGGRSAFSRRPFWLLLGLDGERMNRKCLWGGGAAFGYSLTVNYRWFFVGLLLILGKLAWACFARDRVARRLLFMRVGMFFVF